MNEKVKVVTKPQLGDVELTGKNLPKRLLAKLDEHDRLQTYLVDVCRKERQPYVRLAGEVVTAIRDWSERKLNTIPDHLTYRGRPVIADHQPAPAFELRDA